ncbi:MFS transporter, partial [Mesorhizobium japonicum]|uniref:MFS transporter n=1 Tax=Mesorhizobium japonicum TaxID=2066070 RepID=UPI003B5B8F90
MTATAQRSSVGAITFRLVGFLFLVELASGIIQGWYVPLISDIVRYLHIRDADYNFFEAAQLLVSALVTPVLAKLGDMVGHKRMLLVSTALTALAAWGLVLSHEFWGYLVAFALIGFYNVWLPLEVALIFDRGRRTSTGPSQTRRAAGYLVVALEAGAIIGAL